MRAEQIRVTGAVQGVGFRPHVARLATRLRLRGSVANDPRGVDIHVEGADASIERFARDLVTLAPNSAVIESLERCATAPRRAANFTIRASEETGPLQLAVGPDLALCDACRGELLDPADRRHRYPFLNCTACGPRYSIVRSLPYDRPRTTMAGFAMCPDCTREYSDPADRRYHAQPIACPACGPRLRFLHGSETPTGVGEDALACAVRRLRSGLCLAVKGLGGFHLIVDAGNGDAVQRLRERKRRGTKPLALMFARLEEIEAHAHVDGHEARLLRSPAAPIVLLDRRGGSGSPAGDRLAPGIAPGHPYLGCMLAYTPLHVLLLQELGGPVVATSANLRDEPLCITELEVRKRLADLVDGGILDHERPIARPVEDSVVRSIDGAPCVLRRGRGHAPLALELDVLPETGSALALGAHQKNAVALRQGRRVVFAPHIGDLSTLAARREQERCVEDLRELLGVRPERIACDAHPDLASTLLAEQLTARPVRVPHHEAHVLAVAAEHGLRASFAGLAWDGTGYGQGDPDGNAIWGGEFFQGTLRGLRRIARLRPFPLPGGEHAIRAPWRTAFGLVHGDDPARWPRLARRAQELARQEAPGIAHLLPATLASAPRTSSIGRLFDAVAALLGCTPVAHHEAEAAVQLEALALAAARVGRAAPRIRLEFASGPGALLELDARVLLDDLEAGLAAGRSGAELALAFHHALARVAVDIAQRLGERTVLLSGGCFQNRLLLERTIHDLRRAGHRPLWAQRLPPGDGGLALGQLVRAAFAP